MRALISWIGNTDLKSAIDKNVDEPGPVRRFLDAVASNKLPNIDQFCFMSDFSNEQTDTVSEWLSGAGLEFDRQRDFHLFGEPLSNDYDKTYQYTNDQVENLFNKSTSYEEKTFIFLVSSGTPAMQLSILVVAAGLEDENSGLKVELLATSRQKGVEEVNLPFKLRANMRRGAIRQVFKQFFSAHQVSNAFNNIIGDSPCIRKVKKHASFLSGLENETILLLGETGTGKELFAKAIHESSPRRMKPFLPVNCSAISDSMFEAELFGSVKGSFTDSKDDKKGLVELASGGTLFLDEIGELAPYNQAKILRVIQEKTYRKIGEQNANEKKCDFRIICGTHRDLEAMVGQGAFRLDLFQRISMFPLRIPPLRERGRDVETLACQFLQDFCNNYKELIGQLNFDKEALKALRNYDWPGNVRELQNKVRQMAVFSLGIRSDDKECLITGEVVSEVTGSRSNRTGNFMSLNDATLAENLIAVLVAVLGRWRSWSSDAKLKEGDFLESIILPFLVGYLHLERGLCFESKVGNETVSSSLGWSRNSKDKNNPRLESYNKIKKYLKFNINNIGHFLGGAES